MPSFAGILCLATRFAVVSPPGREPHFSTFSIVAVDPTTGEAGVAVTTRNPCVITAVTR